MLFIVVVKILFLRLVILQLLKFSNNFMTGPQELKVLVELAMISGGETDMDTAKITCLHTSCLAFSPLIFDLKPSFGFEQLMKACSPVWKAAERNRDLPIMLVS